MGGGSSTGGVELVVFDHAAGSLCRATSRSSASRITSAMVRRRSAAITPPFAAEPQVAGGQGNFVRIDWVTGGGSYSWKPFGDNDGSLPTYMLDLIPSTPCCPAP